MEECYLFSPLQGQVGKTAQNANFIGHEKFYRTSWEMELSPWMFNCSSLEKKKKKTLKWIFSSLVANTDASFLIQNIFLMIHC